MSGSISNRGAALFNKPTSSSNSDANTDEGRINLSAILVVFQLAQVLYFALKLINRRSY
uniref:Uncharacterized protein n=2 Tax=Cyprinus carpio TaxID=7962 RepID=A0A8C2KZV0_CYPCA